jgi:orotidine-5'-phosphate decarboxylase
VASPAGAFAGGSSHIVVGRPITRRKTNLKQLMLFLRKSEVYR